MTTEGKPYSRKDLERIYRQRAKQRRKKAAAKKGAEEAIQDILDGVPIDDVVDTMLGEVAPPGWEKTVKTMKKHKDIDNPWAMAWAMKKKGYKSHKKEGEFDFTEVAVWWDDLTFGERDQWIDKADPDGGEITYYLPGGLDVRDANWEELPDDYRFMLANTFFSHNPSTQDLRGFFKDYESHKGEASED